MVKKIKHFLRNNSFYKKRDFLEEIFSPLFTTEWGRRVSWAALVVFSVAFIYTLFSTYITWKADAALLDVKSEAINQSSEDIYQLVSRIPDNHLFGEVGMVDSNSVPVTSLQLHLIGVINSAPEAYARVIISESGQPGKVYGVGDSLLSGITIHAISNDGVILENGGRLEKLPLMRAPLNFQGMPKALIQQE